VSASEWNKIDYFNGKPTTVKVIPAIYIEKIPVEDIEYNKIVLYDPPIPFNSKLIYGGDHSLFGGVSAHL
jgi:hypothetical protein